MLCETFNVGRTSYYNFLKKLKDRTKQQQLDRDIISIFGEHKRRYGARRIVEELKDKGTHVGRAKVRSTMKSYGLIAIQPKSFVPRTTQDNPHLFRNPNQLLDREPPCRPNEVIVGDITYLPLISGGHVYLSTWLDLFSHKIIGWCIYDHLKESIVYDSFKRAMNNRKFPRGMIVHSDGGSQYKSTRFRELLAKEFLIQSMTRRDNHYDNAAAESLFSRLKMEQELKVFKNIEEARSTCFEDIMYYNMKRKHSSIGYKTPNQFEKEYYEKNKK